MSNKAQLQINNTQLATLIQTLQGKAVGGGGGGKPKLYISGMAAERVQCGEYYLSYMCPLDELDFSTLTLDNTTVLVSGVDNGAVDNLILIDTLSADGEAYFSAVDANETFYDANTYSAVFVFGGEVYPAFNMMAKFTPEVIAAAGLSIEPGIYLMSFPDSALTVIYTGP